MASMDVPTGPPGTTINTLCSGAEPTQLSPLLPRERMSHQKAYFLKEFLKVKTPENDPPPSLSMPQSEESRFPFTIMTLGISIPIALMTLLSIFGSLNCECPYFKTEHPSKSGLGKCKPCPKDP